MNLHIAKVNEHDIVFEPAIDSSIGEPIVVIKSTMPYSELPVLCRERLLLNDESKIEYVRRALIKWAREYKRRSE